MDENMSKAYRARHQQACVTAYNALAGVWPPANTEDYWMGTAERFRDVCNENSSNQLCRAFLVVMYDYLGDVVNGKVTVAEPETAHKKAFRTVLDLLKCAYADGHNATEIMDAMKAAKLDEDSPLSGYLINAAREYTAAETKTMGEEL